MRDNRAVQGHRVVFVRLSEERDLRVSVDKSRVHSAGGVSAEMVIDGMGQAGWRERLTQPA
ncbi:hypothetical protein GCM10027269_83520 [Kribbella endophytica]